MVIFENVSKHYGVHKALDQVNFTVNKGKILGLLGQNGAGKTTTMKTVLGLLMADAGEIYVNGEKVVYGQTATNHHIGYLPDVPEFYSFMTTKEYLRFCGEITGMKAAEIKSRSEELLKLVGLEGEKHRIKGFSRGMKQRLGIAAAIMHSPELLILDEPINGLDPFGIKEIRALLKRLSHEFGITILISSHILSEIENLADVIGFMDNGVLIEEMSRDELFNRLDKFVEFEVSDIDLAVNIFKELELRENIDFTVNGNIIRLYSHLNMRDKFNAIFVKAGIDVKKVNLCEENLEEFFTRFVSNN